MISLLNIELLCEMERREREAAFANKHNAAIRYYSGKYIQTSKLIDLLKKMKREKSVPESVSKPYPAITFSSKNLVVKKVNNKE